jgi:hypothetical protein
MSNVARIPVSPALTLPLVLAVVTFVDLPGGWRWIEVLQDAGHVPAFALATWCLVRLWYRDAAPLLPRRLLLAAGGAILLGAGVEGLQYFLGRDASLADVGRDACGAAAAGALLYRRAQDPRRRGARIAALLVLAAAVLLALLPLIECARAYHRRSLLFPVLADFSSPLDLYFLRPVDPPFARQCVDSPPAAAACRRWALYAPYSSTTWAGPVFEELPADWRGRRALCLEVSNPNAHAFTLVVALHDRAYSGQRSDRYTGLWPIGAQLTRTLCLPLDAIRITPGGRLLDLGHIGRLAIAQDDADHQRGFQLHRVWLQ